MPKNPDFASRSDSFVQVRYTIHSGDLGPVDDKFLPDIDGAASGFGQSASLDVARERLNEECRYFQKHLHEVTGDLEGSNALLGECTERRTLAANAVKAITQELVHHSRAAIVKAYQELQEAEVAYLNLKHFCDHLGTQIAHDKRCITTLELALHAMTDATFLSEQPGFDPAPSQLALSANLSPLSEGNLRPKTAAQLIDHEAMLAAREYERHALARGIDERVRYVLSDAVLQAEFCEAALKSDPLHAREVVVELKGRLNEALRETDMLIFELEPMMLSELGLAGTIQRYMHDLIYSRNAPLAVRITGKERRLHIAVERAIFRAAREAVQNALEHSQASHIQIALSYVEDAVILSVEDDGIGFAVDPVMDRARKGFHTGLGQLRIEVDLIGAVLGVKSSPNEGTRIDYIYTEPEIDE